MYKKSFVFTSILLIAVLLSGCAGAALAQTTTPAAESASPRTLTVSGSGKAYLTPDIAYINIGVRSESAEASTAVTGNSISSGKVIDALKELGVEVKDIQTTNFSIYPQQKYDMEGKPSGEITYVVENTVFVTVRNLENIGKLLDAAVSAGANQIYGIQFDVADKSAALSEARKGAVANAQAVAQELAEAAGVTLGEIQTINIVSGGSPIPVFDNRGGMLAAEAASVPVSAGQMVLTVDVSLVYVIR